MRLEFEGQTVFVTGAVRGIGRTICYRFAELGASVWAADIEEQLLPEITDGLDDKVMPRIKTVHLDVTNPKKSKILLIRPKRPQILAQLMC